jgi:hypothetical protein
MAADDVLDYNTTWLDILYRHTFFYQNYSQKKILIFEQSKSYL